MICNCSFLISFRKLQYRAVIVAFRRVIIGLRTLANLNLLSFEAVKMYYFSGFQISNMEFSLHSLTVSTIDHFKSNERFNILVIVL